MPNKILHIDGDVLIYRAGFSAQSRSPELSHALHNVKVILKFLLKHFNTDRAKIFLSNSDKNKNFRYHIAPDYKANRATVCKTCTGTALEDIGLCLKGDGAYRGFKCPLCQTIFPGPKPYHFDDIRRYLIDYFNAHVVMSGEADDWLCVDIGPDHVIVSIDKDLLMVPGTHFRMHTTETIEVNDPGELILEETKYKTGKNRKQLKGHGYRWFFAQMLLGDSIDNIKKPKKGQGPKEIYDLLNNCTNPIECFRVVSKEYHEAGLSSEDIMKNARLLWIQRKPDEDFFKWLEQYGNWA